MQRLVIIAAEESDMRFRKGETPHGSVSQKLSSCACCRDANKMAGELFAFDLRRFNASASYWSNSVTLCCRVRPAQLHCLSSGPIGFCKTNEELFVPERRHRVNTTP